MTNRTDAEVTAEAYARTITRDVEGAADPADAADAYVWDALDANYLTDSTGHVKAVHLITGTGGPHVEVHHYLGTDGVTVRVWWWQDYAERYVHAPTLAAELDGFAEAWQDAYVTVGVRR